MLGLSESCMISQWLRADPAHILLLDNALPMKSSDLPAV